ncbi:MAG TPA: hypothetical protein VMX17_14060 [Candidatus Glassbacteria bacterium]|nr:hypothetical protein [Candidatus Glassbacteria bacterium]
MVSEKILDIYKDELNSPFFVSDDVIINIKKWKLFLYKLQKRGYEVDDSGNIKDPYFNNLSFSLFSKNESKPNIPTTWIRKKEEKIKYFKDIKRLIYIETKFHHLDNIIVEDNNNKIGQLKVDVKGDLQPFPFFKNAAPFNTVELKIAVMDCLSEITEGYYKKNNLKKSHGIIFLLSSIPASRYGRLQLYMHNRSFFRQIL